MNVNVNMRPGEMLRPQPGMQPGILPMNGAQFLGSAQGGPQPAQPPHMAMLPTNSNAPMLMQANGNPNFQLQLQQAHAQAQRGFMPTGAHSQQRMNPALGPGPSHGLGPPSLSGVNFPNPMMQQNAVRRVQSQPQPLNAASGLGGGMHSGQSMMQGVGGMNAMQSMPIPSQMRQLSGQSQVMRLPPGAGGMAPELPMTINRAQGMANGPSFPPHIARTPSQNQSMPNIPQPPTLPQTHPGGIQPSQFPGGMPLQPMHGGQLASSPHPPQNVPGGAMPSNMPGGSGAQAPGNGRRMTPDGMFSFQHANMQSGVHRMTPGGQMGFPVNSTPTQSSGQNQLSDMSQSLNGGTMGTPRVPPHQAHVPTPAQVISGMGNDNASNSFMSQQGTNGGVPQRPPSQQSRHLFQLPVQQSLQPGMPVHRSPQQPNRMAQQMQAPRPQSQPQVQQGQSPQRGASNTPRTQPTQLPPPVAPNRTPMISAAQTQAPVAPPKPPTPAANAGQPLPIASRPSQAVHATSNTGPNLAAPSTGPLTTAPEGGVLQPQPQPQRPPESKPTPLGLGQGLLRLVQFSGVLAGETKDKLQLSFWDKLIKDYFTPRAMLKLTLWKDNQRNEAKPFEIGTPILPRFFLVTSQSGVKSMTLSLDGARERLVGQGHAVIECVQAVWTYKYHNGYTVTLRGPMTAHVLLYITGPPMQGSVTGQPWTLKFDQLQFDANTHDKLINIDAIAGARVDSPQLSIGPLPNGAGSPEDDHRYDEPRSVIEHASIPVEPVNAFGIPQATMRCLELAESVTQMSDLIQFSKSKDIGPKEALKQFAKQLRDHQPQAGPSTAMNGMGGPPNGLSPPGVSGGTGMFDHGINGISASSSSSALYPGPQPPTTQTQPPAPSQQNGPPIVDGTPKLANRPNPQTQTTASASTPSASTPSASTPAAGSITPSLQSQSLKRKAGDSSSPSIANAEQQPQGKRARAKRRGTTTNG